MKLKCFSKGVFLVLATLLASSYVSASPIQRTLWTTTDGNVNIVQIDFSGPQQYALFDDEDSTFGSPLVLADGATVTISESGGSWTATYGANSIDLGPTGCFDFAWNNSGSWDNQYSIVTIPNSNDQYQLNWTGNYDYFRVVDAKPQCNPVPIPAAGYLLLAGMAGLISTRKIRK